MSDSIFDRKWFNGKNVELIDPIPAIVECSKQHHDVIIRIGTDAQRIGKHTDFVTVVCVHFRGNGGRLFYTRTRADRCDMALFEKLMKESWLSLEVAMALEEALPFGKERIEVHIDANPNPRWESHEYHKQLASMVMGQGFNAVLKPYSWVSTHAADRIVKNKHLGRKRRQKYRKAAKKRK